MQLVHEPAAGGRRVLAADVETADSFGDQTRGLMFRTDLPEEYALVFRFEDSSWLERRLSQSTLDRIPFLGTVQYRFIHMLFVRIPLDVVWLVDDEVVRVETLPAWRGIAGARSDAIVELPAGAATDVDPGDRAYLVDAAEEESEGATEPAPETADDDTAKPDR